MFCEDRKSFPRSTLSCLAGICASSSCVQVSSGRYASGTGPDVLLSCSSTSSLCALRALHKFSMEISASPCGHSAFSSCEHVSSGREALRAFHRIGTCRGRGPNQQCVGEWLSPGGRGVPFLRLPRLDTAGAAVARGRTSEPQTWTERSKMLNNNTLFVHLRGNRSLFVCTRSAVRLHPLL